MLEIYLTGHPLEKLKKQIEEQTNINTIQIREIEEEMNNIEDMEMKQNQKQKFVDGQNVKYAGIITSIKKKYTKNNKIMAFITVEDLYGSLEIIVFENAYYKSENCLIEEEIVKIDGRLSIREEEEVKIVANEIKKFTEEKPKTLTINITELEENEKAKLRGAIKYFTGDKNNIFVQIKIGDEIKPCGRIYCTDEILKIFENIVGKEKCSFLI